MIFRQITASGDWTFGKGISGYATGQAAVELNIRTRLQSWKGDCFFALNDHVDWLGRLDRGQEANLTTELRSVILQSFGVISVNSIEVSLNRETRAYQATYNIDTIYGQGFQNQLALTAGLTPGETV